VDCAAEVLERLQAENKELKREHKKFCDIIERAGQYFAFFTYIWASLILCLTFCFGSIGWLKK